jgi:hypothetical protein
MWLSVVKYNTVLPMVPAVPGCLFGLEMPEACTRWYDTAMMQKYSVGDCNSLH